ncbi:MAG TPA: response regulator [Thermoanaerobaculia bacterium]|nr:response regulator [Thermoanaerobaculia bacterium]
MSRRILLADDSVTIQKVIELTFMDEDFEVRAVSNGDEALAALPQFRPEFVIADVHMPGANGYEVCRRAKQQLPEVPVLLLVGTFEPFDEAQARGAGADSFLKKPFDSQELLQRVQDLMASRAATAPAAPAATPTIPAMAVVPPAAPAPPAIDEDVFQLPSIDLGPDPEPAAPRAATPAYSEPEAQWPAFELEPEPEPVPMPAVAPAPEPFQEEQPFSFREERSAGFEAPGFGAGFGGAQPVDVPAQPFAPEDPFTLEGDASLTLEEPPIGLREESDEPAPFSYGEPQDRFLEDAERPILETMEASAAAPEPWSLTDQERLGIPLGQEPLVDSMAETEERIASPWPDALEAAEGVAPHEPAATFSAPAVAAAAYAPAASEAPANGSGRLSDEDVDRIARRVVELLGDKAVRDIAWEVVPDLAEVVIKDRLRELESQVD